MPVHTLLFLIAKLTHSLTWHQHQHPCHFTTDSIKFKTIICISVTICVSPLWHHCIVWIIQLVSFHCCFVCSSPLLSFTLNLFNLLKAQYLFSFKSLVLDSGMIRETEEKWKSESEDKLLNYLIVILGLNLNGCI